MATRSTISVVDKRTEDGSGRTIYCHWDGYLENNGRILLESYTEAKKVNSLIDLGDISSLAENVSPSKKGILRKMNKNYEYDLIPTKEPHSFDNPHNGVVVAYIRDRGEKDCETTTFIGKNPGNNVAQEFDYLFVIEENKWYVRNNHKTRPKFVALTKKMCEG